MSKLTELQKKEEELSNQIRNLQTEITKIKEAKDSIVRNWQEETVEIVKKEYETIKSLIDPEDYESLRNLEELIDDWSSSPDSFKVELKIWKSSTTKCW